MSEPEDFVELDLNASEVRTPTSLDDRDLQVLRKLATRQADVMPDQWVRTRMTRLILASVLESRLLHTRTSRLGAFGLPKDPDQVTLTQLAALWRHHPGIAGQAFELAVADAVNHQVPEVVGPINEALRLLDIHRPVQGMVVTGLEKVPAAHRETVAAQITSHLPEDARLRTLQRGRPAHARNVGEKVMAGSWADMGRDPSQTSQLPRADALVYTDRDVLGTSLKISGRDVYPLGWRDVPLWVTRTAPWPLRVTPPGFRAPGAFLNRKARATTAVVVLGDSAWSGCFDTALASLDHALAVVDGPHRGQKPGRERAGAGYPPLSTWLVRNRHRPISDLVAELRDVHPALVEIVGPRISAEPTTLEVETPGVPEVKAAWYDAAARGAVITGQRHLFLPGPDAQRQFLHPYE